MDLSINAIATAATKIERSDSLAVSPKNACAHNNPKPISAAKWNNFPLGTPNVKCVTSLIILC